MSSLANFNLEITQDDKFQFFRLYDTLGKDQKTIWQRICWYAIHKPYKHYSQAYIARGIPCSRKHVNRTFAQFKKWGWIWLKSRGRGETKIINIDQKLLMIDVKKREWLTELKVTSKVTREVLGSSSTGGAGDLRKNLKEDPPPICQKRQKAKKTTEKDLFMLPIEMKHIAGMDSIPREYQMKMALVPLAYVARAIQNCIFKGKRGDEIRKEAKYLKETAIRMAQADNVLINWRQWHIWREAEELFGGKLGDRI